MKKGIAFALVALGSILVCTALAGSEKKLDALLALPVTETKVFVESNEEPLFVMLKRSLPEETDMPGSQPVSADKGTQTAQQKADETGSAWMQQLRYQADQGDAKSAFWLGRFTVEDSQDTKKIDEGIRLVRRSAEQGFMRAQLYLGMLYAYGVHVKADPVEAEKWLSTAAKQGSPMIQLYLGLMYGHGKGGAS